MSFTLALALALADQAPPPRLVGELWELKTPTGTLSGTLDLPAGKGPWPVVLIHPGSGNTDRNGNSIALPLGIFTNNSLKMLGRALADRGIAVLRIDKRGVAASAKAMVKESDLRVDTYAADVTAWVALLRKDGRFTKVGIVGHSEGTLIGLLAAKEATPDAFVCLCGLARPFQDLLREQLKDRLSKDGFDQADKIMTELAAGRPVKDVPLALYPYFRPSIQPYMISAFKRDPATLVADFPGPVLVVSGTTDLQVPVSDGDRLAKAKPGAKRLVVDGMNHVLKADLKAVRIEDQPTYRDPVAPLHPKLVDELAGFLKESLGAK
ncbi:MAG TPA: alpha/beta fold hydrolase [Gemmataceae bacterium]|nr:alpha/beta fold hydrolase [Gemmataceae bacterium]